MPWSGSDYAFAFLHALGALFVCAALFLHEDEEGKIQNKVEEWWIKLSDKEKGSRSQDAAFMQEVAELTGRGLDRLLGKPLLSLRFVFISISFSLASFFLFAFLSFPLVHNPPAGYISGAFRLFLFFLTFALVPAWIESKALLEFRWGVIVSTLLKILWWGVIVLALLKIMDFLLFVSRTRGLGPTARGVGYVALPFAFSLFCDLSYIVLTRWILRRISKIDRVYEIVLQVLVNLLVLAILIYVPVFFGSKVVRYSPLAGGVLALSFVLNSIDIVAGFAALVLALLLLLHRLLWPVIERPIYAIHRFAPVRNKKLLWGIGIALIFLPKHTTTELLKSILEKL